MSGAPSISPAGEHAVLTEEELGQLLENGDAYSPDETNEPLNLDPTLGATDTNLALLPPLDYALLDALLETASHQPPDPLTPAQIAGLTEPLRKIMEPLQEILGGCHDGKTDIDALIRGLRDVISPAVGEGDIEAAQATLSVGEGEEGFLSAAAEDLLRSFFLGGEGWGVLEG